jgi:hypothetical protein
MKLPRSTVFRTGTAAAIRNKSSKFRKPAKLKRWILPGGSLWSRSGLSLNRATIIGLVCIGMLSVESRAAITFSNPFRSVVAGNNKGSYQETVSAAMGQFTETARVDHEGESGPPFNFISEHYSVSTQDSMIGLAGITARGSVRGGGTYAYYGESPLNQYSQSSFKVDFSVGSTTTIYLTGTVHCYSEVGGPNLDWPEVTISLSGADGIVYSRTFYYSQIYLDGNFEDVTDHELNEAFTSLEAGDYEFVVSAIANGYYENVGGYGVANFDVTLVPEPSIIPLLGLGMLLIRRKR